MRYAHIARRGEKPRLALPDATLTYHETDYMVGRYLWAKQSHISKRNAGVRLNDNYSYDIRIVSPEDERTIQDILEQINALNLKLRLLVDEQFMTWQPATKADCSKVIPGRSLAEAKAQLRREKSPSQTALAGEGMTLRAIRSLGG